MMALFEALEGHHGLPLAPEIPGLKIPGLKSVAKIQAPDEGVNFRRFLSVG